MVVEVNNMSSIIQRSGFATVHIPLPHCVSEQVCHETKNFRGEADGDVTVSHHGVTLSCPNAPRFRTTVIQPGKIETQRTQLL